MKGDPMHEALMRLARDGSASSMGKKPRTLVTISVGSEEEEEEEPSELPEEEDDEEEKERKPWL